MLGSALKVIAGTPDFEDWKQIKFRQLQLIQAENNQIDINSKIQTQFNLLFQQVNSISMSHKIDFDHLYETVLAKNRAVITELENLMASITLAKITLLSPVILDNIGVRRAGGV